MFRIPSAIPESQIVGDFDIETSKIYALGLASAQSSSDRAQDVIMTAAQAILDPEPGLFSPFSVITTGQTAVDYEVSLQSV